MTIMFKQNTVTVKVNFNAQNDFIDASVHGYDCYDDNALPPHYSILGEVGPALAPLSIDYALVPDGAYRYDWVVGLGPVPRAWGKELKLRSKRAVTVQLVVNCHNSGVSFSDTSPMLLGLQPSLYTSSWWDRNADKTRAFIKGMSDAAKPYIPVVPRRCRIELHQFERRQRQELVDVSVLRQRPQVYGHRVEREHRRPMGVWTVAARVDRLVFSRRDE